jgi:hypothetical protein
MKMTTPNNPRHPNPHRYNEDEDEDDAHEEPETTQLALETSMTTMTTLGNHDNLKESSPPNSMATKAKPCPS